MEMGFEYWEDGRGYDVSKSGEVLSGQSSKRPKKWCLIPEAFISTAIYPIDLCDLNIFN